MLEIIFTAVRRVLPLPSFIDVMIPNSAVDSMILASILSEEGSASDRSLEEVHTVASKPRNCINRSQAHIQALILHQGNDLRERS
jgi:hypothetical protein